MSALTALGGVLCSFLCVLVSVPAAQSDLDAFMREVLARRDDNWKKLQQYVLDEREQIVINGPSKLPLWGDRREYTWYIRDGFFVRSPLKVNGVTVSEEDRRKFEADYLKRAQERERRGARGTVAVGGSGVVVETPERPDPGETPPSDIDGILKQTRQPGFVSSAYFLRFKFEEGKYALVGRESLDGRDVLRIEYYPTRLFSSNRERRQADEKTPKDKAYDAELQRLLNKVSLVTLWVEPKSHQIVKYDFKNLPFDFLPGSWLVHIDDLNASMTMGQPFPDVWLPAHLEFAFAMSLAIGPIDARYDVDYHDYKQADVTTKVKIR